MPDPTPLVPFTSAADPVAQVLLDLGALFPNDDAIQNYVNQGAAYDPQYHDLLGLCLLALDRAMALNNASIQTYTLPAGQLAYVVNGVLTIVGTGSGVAADLEVPGNFIVDGLSTFTGRSTFNGAVFAPGIPNQPPNPGDLVLMRTADGHIRAVSLNALPTIASSAPGAYSGNVAFNAAESSGGLTATLASPITNVFAGVSGAGMALNLQDNTRVFIRTQIIGTMVASGGSNGDYSNRFIVTLFMDGIQISVTPYDLPNAATSVICVNESFALPPGNHVITMSVALNRAPTDGTTRVYTLLRASLYAKS